MREWLDGAREKLLGDGYWGVCEALAAPMADEETSRRLGTTAAEVLNYFSGHQGRLGYALRLRRGQERFRTSEEMRSSLYRDAQPLCRAQRLIDSSTPVGVGSPAGSLSW